MFTASADLYDVVYAGFKEYPAEARAIASVIRAAHPAARTVLDVACGTGEHARLLVSEHGFLVDGVDLDPAFVRIAAAKLSRGNVFEGDMTQFALGRHYDVVVCLFSSIGYARTLDRVRRALACFRAHLAPGGVVLVEPWFPPGALEAGRVTVRVAEAAGVHVARMSHVEIVGRVSRLRFDYLIGRVTGIEHATEVHELGLFTPQEMLGAFDAVGLQATFDPVGPSGRGLYVAREEA